MNAIEISKRYLQEPEIQDFAKAIIENKYQKFHLKGMAGSLYAFLFAAIHTRTKLPMMLIMNDKEEAMYASDDLRILLPNQEIHYYPASYKRPYHVEEIDNANVLQRGEVLNELNHSLTKRPIIVTFAEALYEKVINRRSLVKHTFEINKGDTIGMDFLIDLLDEYGFEREEFVYEAGQFSVRGGILDVFSFAADAAYRIEFFGDEIDSIRSFDISSQMTEKEVQKIFLLPNIQTNLLTEKKVSLLEYIAGDTLVCTLNIEFVKTDLNRIFEKAKDYYQKIQKNSGGAAVSKTPETMYLDGDSFVKELGAFSVIEFGNQVFYPAHKAQLTWQSSPQNKFHKAFELLSEHLKKQKENDINTFILSDNPLQIKRLQEIFEAFGQKDLFIPSEGEIHEGFVDTKLGIACYTDHQIFDRYHKYKAKSDTEKSQLITLKELRELKSGDYVTHINHGIGRFAGLHKVQMGDIVQEAMKIIFADSDEILVNVNALHKVSKFIGRDSEAPKLSKLGSANWEKAKAKTKNRVKTMAFDLVQLYAMRKAQPRQPYSPDNYMQQELEASFMYEDTPDQTKATEDIKNDFAKNYPMDRLICGDVGFGKTEIAVRAAFKACCEGKQVAILVPTTILALQHYKSFANRFRNFPVTVDFVSRFRTDKEIKETLQNVADGKVDILIGTHRIVSKDVVFKDLGLMIIDEEQRFGVNVKDKLKTMKVSIDALTLTATPIPRTLQFSLSGIRDLSVITTPPPNRQPIETVITKYDAAEMRDAITYELKRGGQVFFIHPRVKDIEEVAAGILKLVPDAKIRIAHGQMTGEKLEDVMTAFIENQFDILVATTIIESGLDIPNANTIIINEANKYGLSELHQMRGRVGRSNRKAFCYLISPPDLMLTTDARKRLKAMQDFSDLGSGFHIAMRDLDIRGAGEMFGGEQTGFVAEIGYEMYNRILDEAIMELKEEHFSELFTEEIAHRKKILVEDVQVDMDLDIKIPDVYIPSVSERLNFYRRIALATKEDDFRMIQREMIDRFGPMPGQVLHLFDATRIREAAKRCGLEKVILKGKVLKLSFVTNQDSAFYKGDIPTKILQYVMLFSAKMQMKETPKGSYILRQGIESTKDVLEVIEEMLGFIQREI